jgi:hypothetical protein
MLFNIYNSLDKVEEECFGEHALSLVQTKHLCENIKIKPL